jgi:hypothetical protein
MTGGGPFQYGFAYPKSAIDERQQVDSADHDIASKQTWLYGVPL